jgi:hypothetical protein
MVDVYYKSDQCKDELFGFTKVEVIREHQHIKI